MDPQLSKKVKWCDWGLRTILGMTYTWLQIHILIRGALKSYKTTIPLMVMNVIWLVAHTLTDIHHGYTTNIDQCAKNDSWPTHQYLEGTVLVPCWSAVGRHLCGIAFATMPIHIAILLLLNDNFYHLAIILQQQPVYSMPFLVQIYFNIYNGRCLSRSLDRRLHLFTLNKINLFPLFCTSFRKILKWFSVCLHEQHYCITFITVW